ncbi:trans-aconitate methyltransferase [Mycobacterium sp. GA-1285]|uniref:trans-aconitate 2-methyltransferase n=1 Tax=Mycobacterium sp. GA-1285 TaxID=1772282 RepID=UPI0007497C2B|nr:trans-aconitate 2-methyltransferase [Mycobacterium sp. GA-1285]KUI22527.1 trans-aconitate methyltransferase [Mycobacterium sp. GA-1285]
MWNPDAYLKFADERGRPYLELLSRVGADAPRRVADLGCGPGNLTAALAQRWPQAFIEALDSSPEMVQAARKRGIDATVGDVRDWVPKPDTDVAISNAVLHWIPDHAQILVRWVAQLPARSWIAMQVPGNFEAPSHRLVRDLTRRERWLKPLQDSALRESPVKEPIEYADLLADAGCTVDAWETTYVHVLTGEKPVLDWITETALRPVRSRLTEAEWDEFRTELHPLLASAYPKREDGVTLFPFRRIFVVAQVD